MTRRTDTVGLVASETEERVFGDPFFAQVLRGASQRLNADGVELTFTMTQADDDPDSLVRYLTGGHVGGARTAAQHLRRQGRQRVATVTGPLDMSAGVDRLEGFRAGLGRVFNKGHVAHGDFATESGTAATATLLDHDPHRRSLLRLRPHGAGR